MKQEDWTSRLYDRLADYEETAPDDLWAGIEAALAKQEASPTPARRIPLWSRWAVAAAFAGLVIGGGYMMWPIGEDSPESQGELVTIDSPAVLDNQGILDHLAKQEELVKPERLAAIPSLKPVASETTPGPTPDSEPASEPESQLEPTPQSQSGSEPQPTPQSDPQPDPAENRTILAELDRQIAAGKHHRSNNVAFSLYASNGFGDQQHRNGVLMSPSLLANYNYAHSATRAADTRVWLYNYEEQQMHYQPVSFGLTVRIPISSVFSLSSGVAYTRLRSDFTNIANGYTIEQRQTLHYLGIPLSGQYRLWHLHGLNVYATAGGQMDINVKAKYVSSGVEVEFRKDRLQFSVQGALGIQYDIIPQLGIYAEPGIKYYFDNGSHVRNFFKDKPTNFNLQVGLRLNL